MNRMQDEFQICNFSFWVQYCCPEFSVSSWGQILKNYWQILKNYFTSVRVRGSNFYIDDSEQMPTCFQKLIIWVSQSKCPDQIIWHLSACTESRTVKVLVSSLSFSWDIIIKIVTMTGMKMMVLVANNDSQYNRL